MWTRGLGFSGDDCRRVLVWRDGELRGKARPKIGTSRSPCTALRFPPSLGSRAIPNLDGSQNAVEVHTISQSMHGARDGHRDGWPGAPNGTITNGAVGETVSSFDGPVLTVKFKDGEKKIFVERADRAL
jgi:hypothetical protein